jgi:hypothetical protein
VSEKDGGGAFLLEGKQQQQQLKTISTISK